MVVFFFVGGGGLFSYLKGVVFILKAHLIEIDVINVIGNQFGWQLSNKRLCFFRQIFSEINLFNLWCGFANYGADALEFGCDTFRVRMRWGFC